MPAHFQKKSPTDFTRLGMKGMTLVEFGVIGTCILLVSLVGVQVSGNNLNSIFRDFKTNVAQHSSTSETAEALQRSQKIAFDSQVGNGHITMVTGVPGVTPGPPLTTQSNGEQIGTTVSQAALNANTLTVTAPTENLPHGQVTAPVERLFGDRVTAPIERLPILQVKPPIETSGPVRLPIHKRLPILPVKPPIEIGGPVRLPIHKRLPILPVKPPIEIGGPVRLPIHKRLPILPVKPPIEIGGPVTPSNAHPQLVNKAK